MGNLLYKTLAGASPEGLPRVYFCAHPADRRAFWEITARELFAVRNCSLWYDTDPDHPLPDRDWQLELNQMQLFVVTVTARFLYEDCRARLVELPFALEQHIPVMPILREPGLAEDFSRLCGTMQALDPCTQDPTALPYPAKLRAFLESVLIGDELAAQVRQAFDAYIFLSYRKRDRQEARELMRQIHEEPFCRDVAIWYDEFLTAGEDFNRSIAEALQKSRLFALVVTPHLNEEQNYVQRVEYPLARKAGKAVMPVEMTPTDRGELEKHFAGLPPCVSGQDKTALSEMLLKNLRDLALRPWPEDPRHDYFIGLAYLGGIDVEVNPDRGAALIRSAADRRFVPAVRRWAAMLRYGEGTARDPEESVRWQQILTEALEQRWRESGEADDLTELLTELGNLVTSLWELERMDQALAASRRGLSLSEQGAPRMHLLFLAITAIALRMTGQLTQAIALLEQCAALEKAPSQWDPAHDMVLPGLLSQLGMFCLELGKPAAARRWYEEAVACAEENLRVTGGEAAHSSLADAYTRMADLFRAEDSPQQAFPWARKAWEVNRRLLEEQDTPHHREAAGKSLGLLALLCREEGRYSEAEDWLRQKLNLLEEGNRRTPSPFLDRCVADTCIDLGFLFYCTGALSRSREWYQRGLAALEQEWAAHPAADLCGALLDAYEEMGSLHIQERDLPAARARYEKALAMARALPGDASGVRTIRLAHLFHQLGFLCRLERDLPAARKWYEKEHALCAGWAAQSPTARAHRLLAESCLSLGELCLREGDSSGARHWYEKALEIHIALLEESGSPARVKALLETHRSLCRLPETSASPSAGSGPDRQGPRFVHWLADRAEDCLDRGDADDARALCSRGIELLLTVTPRTGSVEEDHALARSAAVLARACQALDRREDAIYWYQKAGQRYEALARTTRLASMYGDTALCRYALSLLEADWQPLLADAITIWETLARECPDIPDYARNLALARQEQQRRLAEENS